MKDNNFREVLEKAEAKRKNLKFDILEKGRHKAKKRWEEIMTKREYVVAIYKQAMIEYLKNYYQKDNNT